MAQRRYGSLKLALLALALLMLTLSGAYWVRAEDAHQPAPAAEGAPPAAGGAAAEAADAQGPQDLSNPNFITGAQPVLPLKSDKYDLIDDSYENIGGNFDSDRKEMEMEYGPMEDIMVALRACSQDYLKQHIDEKATFREMMKHPEKYRGHVVRLVGILADSHVPNGPDYLRNGYPATPNLSGFSRVYKGQTTNINGEIVSFRSMEPLPPDVHPGKPVQLIGIFMKRFCYLNRDPGEKLTWTPLLFVRRLEPFQTKILAQNNPMSNTAAIIVFIIIGLGAAGYLYARQKYKTAAANHFTQLKMDKDERPRGIFPRRTAIRKPAPKNAMPKAEPPGHEQKPDGEKKPDGDEKPGGPAGASGEQGAPAS